MIRALSRLGVDDLGLDSLDRRILEVVAAHRGVPVGVKTISVTVGEEERTIEDVYEPYLIRTGFLVKTPRGRVLGPRADEIPGLPKLRPSRSTRLQTELFDDAAVLPERRSQQRTQTRNGKSNERPGKEQKPGVGE